MSAALSLPGRIDKRPSEPDVSNGGTNRTTAESSTTDSIELNEKDADQQHDREILNLARRFTTRSEYDHHQSPFTAEKGSHLDPNSGHFSAKAWARAFYNARYSSDHQIARKAGVAFRNLNVWGMGSPTDFQTSAGNAILKFPALFGRGQSKIDILQNLDGLLLPGEQLCVLGPPGSGCSTLLKTIAGETHGFKVSPDSYLNYHGITPENMNSAFRGEAIYTAEVDAHFPQLSVGTALKFAALARTPQVIPGGVSRHEYAEHLRDVIMAMFGISHTINTRVGNDLVRGVSGGERKRVTIAEAALSHAAVQCWDNSTRGLDSANAVEFCKTLRTQCDVFSACAVVAIYQAPQAAYDLFDKVTVLYEGRQIFFGKADAARAYFERLGFECPTSQTTPDFLTSMTSPSERVVKPGFENLAPRTSDDFARHWNESPERKELLRQLEDYDRENPLNGEGQDKFAESRRLEKSKIQREKSPFTLSYWGQVKLCMWREVQRLRNDPSVTLTMLFVNFVEALIIASIFFNLPDNTSSFFKRGAVLFMMVLLNGFGSMMEIMSLYEKRTIVEKHNRYALYHPSAEALASMIVDLPYKITNAFVVNSTLYFMSNLRREAGPFFFFMLISFTMTLSMSMFFRFFASITKTIEQALAPSGIILLGLVLYTGFAIPIPYMRGWASWMRWINPIAYGFESVVVNEFEGRDFPCTAFVPSGGPYDNVAPDQRACAVPGAVPGLNSVNGPTYVRTAYQYEWSHRWRNFGIIVAFVIVLCALHLIMTELVASQRSKGEVLVFRRGKMQRAKAKRQNADEETGGGPVVEAEKHDGSSGSGFQVEKQSSIFHWENVCYEVKIKGEPRTILDHVDGWVKPGTLTALMGVSGAGKTTLLDVLASRTTMGVITGNMFVDGRELDDSFQRQTGYCMQQDIHLSTSTVREALEFSAILRQPPEYSHQEKLAYVDQVISLLNMEEYADAVVGIPGSGLNVEQRKRLTIGVELAARPKLLLFLDEPTSGLDSQTSWSICDLMEKLTRNGQAILCTIHQPSAMLFQRFDRLLLLAKGGRTVYFGEIGRDSQILMDYFVRNGGPACPDGANPAEHMLNVIGAAPGAHTDIDWPTVWRSSNEYQSVQTELGRLRNLANQPSPVADSDASKYQEFAAPFLTQLTAVGMRVFQQYWRTPSYIYSRLLLCVGSSIFIGFSFFDGTNTQQGLQNQMFGVFIFLFVTIQMLYQVLPMFTVQRSQYEARERQSKTYAWPTFVLSNIFVEMVLNTFVTVLCFFVWYYPIGLWRNAEPTDAVAIRGFLTFMILWATFLFASTLAHMLIAGAPGEEIASAFATLLGIMLYAFCGILAGPNDLPGFWIFMYRVNPYTYLVSSLLSTTLGRAPAHCADNEFQRFFPPSGQSCGEYLQPYMDVAGGYLRDGQTANGTEECHFCQIDNTDMFLDRIHANFENRWRDFGLLWVYVAFNIAGAMFLYWLVRVPKGKKRSKA
ncbi:ABC multidrug transporter [Aaosphaeria arxii CBS 175.79]|uniref:ABC multidrug transporter n=1 Tax=Aaosphaeria arxii CBS 175.79 TaxID=1450172 RepID=A0A6A5Y103_9PLEO|nr:ABC multidrug transporter [Aaosphaeria arxii CBS 175.79]KAF2018873.1 ABC multidrug transporter [Aaosphaeria arxii CBS 175.79]